MMSFDEQDDIAALLSLRELLRDTDHASRIGMLVFLWQRLGALLTATGSLPLDKDERFRAAVISQLVAPERSVAGKLARETEANALRVPEAQSDLALVGYWSIVSYMFRYLETSESAWAAHAADPFFSALDKYAGEHPGTLRVEMVNLSQAIETASKLQIGTLAREAEGVIRWAASVPMGRPLPPLAEHS